MSGGRTLPARGKRWETERGNARTSGPRRGGNLQGERHLRRNGGVAGTIRQLAPPDGEDGCRGTRKRARSAPHCCRRVERDGKDRCFRTHPGAEERRGFDAAAGMTRLRRQDTGVLGKSSPAPYVIVVIRTAIAAVVPVSGCGVSLGDGVFAIAFHGHALRGAGSGFAFSPARISLPIGRAVPPRGGIFRDPGPVSA